MRDREAINRFCAFKLLGRARYTGGDMDTFLAQGLRQLTALTDVARLDLRSGFERALALNRELFGEHAFRRSLASNHAGARRTPLNISLFEVCTVSMFGLSLSAAQKHILHEGLIELMTKDERFTRAISYSTNSSQPVEQRFSALEQLVKNAKP
jgi:hypothetical protein